jgi:hypothetical protein
MAPWTLLWDVMIARKSKESNKFGYKLHCIISTMENKYK